MLRPRGLPALESLAYTCRRGASGSCPAFPVPHAHGRLQHRCPSHPPPRLGRAVRLLHSRAAAQVRCVRRARGCGGGARGCAMCAHGIAPSRRALPCERCLLLTRRSADEISALQVRPRPPQPSQASLRGQVPLHVSAGCTVGCPLLPARAADEQPAERGRRARQRPLAPPPQRHPPAHADACPAPPAARSSGRPHWQARALTQLTPQLKAAPSRTRPA